MFFSVSNAEISSENSTLDYSTNHVKKLKEIVPTGATRYS